MSGKKKILFVCNGNTCRSQMAEGFAKAYSDGRAEIKSAGTSAAGVVNKSAIKAMGEKGIDISTQTSDQLTEEMIEWADMVITMGCCSSEELCPADYKGKKIDWQIEDPLGMPWEVMVRVRDDIEKNVRELLDNLD